MMWMYGRGFRASVKTNKQWVSNQLCALEVNILFLETESWEKKREHLERKSECCFESQVSENIMFFFELLLFSFV